MVARLLGRWNFGEVVVSPSALVLGLRFATVVLMTTKVAGGFLHKRRPRWQDGDFLSVVKFPSDCAEENRSAPRHTSLPRREVVL